MNWLDLLWGRSEKDLLTGVPLWREVLLDLLNRKDSFMSPYSPDNFYHDSKGMYSGKDNITYLYTLDEFPRKLPANYRAQLRKVANSGARVSFIESLFPERLDWGSAKMKSKLQVWQKVDETHEEINAYNYRENADSVDQKMWRRLSLMYLVDGERRTRRFFRFNGFLVIAGVRGAEFDKAVRDVENNLDRMRIKATRVTQNFDKTLTSASPFTSTALGELRGKMSNNVISDEIVARFTDYSQGKIGAEGTYWGTDILSGSPVFKVIKRTTEAAENILISAETGGGKSFFLKVLLLEMLGETHPSGRARFRGTIMDIEGFEYLPMAEFLANNDEVLVINMAEGQGRYFDPVEIHLSGDIAVDRDMKAFSTSFTSVLLRTLLPPKILENSWVDGILKNAISSVYARSGVTEDINTWHFSEGLTLFHMYDEIIRVCEEGMNYQPSGNRGVEQAKYEQPSYREAIAQIYDALRSYFDPAGMNASVFRERVQMRDIRSAKLVVCSFGMAGKNDKSIDPIQMNLAQLYAANISQVRSLFSKNDGVFHFKVWEEFQRWGNFPGSAETINSALTGGRKLGDVNIISTNKLSELLQTDRFGILENIQTFAIGAINDSYVREEICKRLSIEKLRPELDRIANNKSSGNTYNSLADDENRAVTVDSKYLKSFLVRLDSSVPVITKMQLPDDIASSDLFRTGVDIKEA